MLNSTRDEKWIKNRVEEGGKFERQMEKVGEGRKTITLRTIIIVLPPLTFRTYQILPHTNSYFHCLHSCLDLLQELLGCQGGFAPLGEEVQTAVKTVKVAVSMR